MATERNNTYEAMFLLSQSVASDLAGAAQHITDFIEKAGGTIVSMQRWSDQRLAYAIDKQRRGTYILVYFTGHPSCVATIERSSNLSEQVLRHLIIRADHYTLDEMKLKDKRDQMKLEDSAAADESKASQESQQAETVAASSQED